MKENLIGKKYNRLTIIEFSHNVGRRRYWKCLCECGTEKVVREDGIKGGQVKSCGCLHYENTPQAINLTGQIFGRLTVIERADLRPELASRSAYWKCLCKCGNITETSSNSLRRGLTNSCGCLSKTLAGERMVGNTYAITHGQKDTRLYHIWEGMKQRCYNPNQTRYSDYGGRGIFICLPWKDYFEVFAEWAYTNGYQDNLSIDRIDNDDGYYPGNCKWSTSKEQMNNRRNILK